MEGLTPPSDPNLLVGIETADDAAVYRLSDEVGLTLYLSDGTKRILEGLVLDEASSREIFRRSGRIARVEASLTPGLESL